MTKVTDSQRIPPGYPGIPPRWTIGAKTAVGRSFGERTRVWFTIAEGIITEVYYPRADQANIRDLGFLVADGSDFFSEERRHTIHQIVPLARGVLGYRLTNTCERGRYRIRKTILTDSYWDALVQYVQFEALQGKLSDYGLYALLAPHIANGGNGNSGWIGEYKGIRMFFAERRGTTLALACSVPFRGMSCGYVGTSDGWQDINAHKRMTWFYSQSPDGNIALTGEIDLEASGGRFTLALAFGHNTAEAGQRARAALLHDERGAVKRYVHDWEVFQERCLDLTSETEMNNDLYRTSVAVVKSHSSPRFPGGIIASLSVPWGFAKGDDDLGGYHLVWPRDLVESAGGLLAAGDVMGAKATLFFLMCTQEADGHWPQNMWIDGTPYWNGIQMDETAFPILLADALRREQALEGIQVWPMVRRAASFLVRNGPVTQQDRWEEDGGYSPFTLAVEIAALLASADFADDAGESDTARFLRETADTWNGSIEQWTYCTGTDLARQVGVDGYYVRIRPPEVSDAASPKAGFVPIKNRPLEQSYLPAGQIISPDALALVRFGLRAANDSRIVNTVKVIDALLKTETTTGPVWHRYDGDGYGEHDDGSPFDGTGVGRGWPLLAGERAHYELASGRHEEAKHLLRVMTAQTSDGRMIPEQIWDAPDIPERGLYNGYPSGSAMPLVWAHAEYIKLVRSLRDGRVFDLPPQTVERYQVKNITSPFTIWGFNHKCRRMTLGKKLRVVALAPAVVHWSTDGWHTTQDLHTHDTGLEVHHADLATDKLPAGALIQFTFYWPEANHWEGVDFEVVVEKS